MNIYAEALTEIEKNEFDARSVLFEIARKNPGAYVSAVKRLRGQKESVEWKQKCRELLNRGDKMAAIKLWRDMAGCSLKEAKDAVEAL